MNKYWAKKKDGRAHLLQYHNLDSAAVAFTAVQGGFKLLNITPEEAALMASLHDIGKFSYLFQQQLSQSPRHDSMGHLLLNAPFLTGHHGKPPNPYNKYTGLKLKKKKCFTGENIEDAYKYIEDMYLFFKLSSLPYVAPINTWAINGFITMCDWIASNEDYFEYVDTVMPYIDYWDKYALPQAKLALGRTKLLSPVKVRQAPMRIDYIKTPTPLQCQIDAIPITNNSQTVIIEDLTGSGKTEAAIMLAKRMMSKKELEGVFIGLPSMATSNAMNDRMKVLYRQMYTEDSEPTTTLVHSTSMVNRQEWLTASRKVGLLANVVIATVDQALLSVLPIKHQSLRLLGLRGKVLILDEVHSFDDYTNQLIAELIKIHIDTGGSVILLSATLTKEARKLFAPTLTIKMDYPLIQTDDYAKTYEIPTVSKSVVHINTEEEAIKLLTTAHSEGKRCCWVRNTVSEAQATYSRFSSDTVLLFHSKFTVGDRLAIEEKVLRHFGKNRLNEPTPILIATQVVEQSLDLDFDVMVTDIAPAEAIIQRAGRLFRHMRLERTYDPVLYILAPNTIEEHISFFTKGQYVYQDHNTMYKTLETLMKRGKLVLPEDARLLVEQKQVNTKRDADKAIANINKLDLEDGYLVDSGKWHDDTLVSTRLGTLQDRVLLKHCDGTNWNTKESLSYIRLPRHGEKCETIVIDKDGNGMWGKIHIQYSKDKGFYNN